MKKISALLTLIALLISQPAFAFKESAYAGVEVGQAKLNVSVPFGNVQTNNGNLGGRLFFGYQFHRYVAAEAGITKYANIDVNNVFGIPGAKEKITAESGDAVVKVILPIERFNLFAKLGFAAIHTKATPNHTAKEFVPDNINISGSETKAKPLYGLGAGADLNPNFTVTFDWTKISTNSNKVNSATFTSIGFLYRFEL